MKVGIIGATGLAGRELIKIFEEKSLNGEITLLSRKKKGFIETEEAVYPVVPISKWEDFDIVFSAVEKEVSFELFKEHAKEKPVVIDFSSAFRELEDVPLVVPPVNGSVLEKRVSLIANPNCSTAGLVLVLDTIDKIVEIERVRVATYQSVSGAGRDALNEFFYESEFFILGKTPDSIDIFPEQIAGNVLPGIGEEEEGYYTEEKKIINETRKILEKEIDISAITVRVPTVRSHCEAVFIDLKNDFSDTIIDALNKSPYITFDKYPTPIKATGKDNVFVGRVLSPSLKHLQLFLCSDNLRRGASLNAFEIYELIKNKWF